MHGPWRVRVFVALVDEGVDVWRPVEAVPVGPGEYRIVSHNEHPEDEHWQFQEGDRVRCEMMRLSGDDPVLVAVEKAEEAV